MHRDLGAGLIRDARFAMRICWRRPAQTLIVGTTLAIATAVNAGVFAIFHTVVLQPWPVGQPHEIVRIIDRDVRSGRTDRGFSLTDLDYMQRHATTLAGVIGYAGGGSRVSLSRGGVFEHVISGYVSANFFAALDVPLESGRAFGPADDGPSAPPVVLVSHALWRRLTGGAPLGAPQTVYVNDIAVTLVGIVGRDVRGAFPFTSQIWLPISALRTLSASHPLVRPDASEHCCVGMAGRLQRGVTRERAAAEFAVLFRQIEAAADTSRTVSVTGTPALESAPGRERPLLLLLIAVAVVQILACANIGNLQLGQAFARRDEIRTRLRMGATRRAVIRQLCFESVPAIVVAGVIGLVTAQLLPSLILGSGGDWVQFDLIAPRRELLLFILALSGVTAVLVGVMPALSGTRDAAAFASVDRALAAVSRPTLRSLLLGTQVALSATCLFGALLLTRNMIVMLATPLEFDVAGLSVGSITVRSGDGRFSDRARLSAAVRDAVSAQGSSAIGLVDVAPLQASRIVTTVRQPGESVSRARAVHLRPISAATFGVLPLPFVAGRAYRDDAVGREVVVNEAFARAFWAGESAIGKRLVQDEATVEVVGVVKDTHYADLGPIEPMLHQPRLLTAPPQLLVRSHASGEVQEVRGRIEAALPSAKVAMAPLEASASGTLVAAYRGVSVAWALSLLALVLATGGIFTVFSSIVSERRVEIAIRLAIGARRWQIVQMLLQTTGRALGIGALAALMASFVVAGVLRSFIVVGRFDALTYAATLLILTVGALLGTAWPLRRALATNTNAVLKSQ